MFGEHKTSEGNIMLICTMNDQHLKNTLHAFVVRPYKQLLMAKEVTISNSSRFLTSAQKMELKRLACISKKDPEQYKVDLLQKYANYILEGLRRKSIRDWVLSDIVGALDEDLGRGEVIVVPEIVATITHVNELDVVTDDYDKYDDDL